MISGNKKNNVSRLRYTHLPSNALPFNSLIRIIICDRSSSLKQVLHSFHFVFHDIKMHFYITPFIPSEKIYFFYLKKERRRHEPSSSIPSRHQTSVT